MAKSKSDIDYRQTIEDRLGELPEGEQVDWLVNELVIRTKEAAGVTRKNLQLQAQLDGTVGDDDDDKPAAADETVEKTRALYDALRAREGVIRVKEHALERAERENIPFSLALKLAADSTEDTDANLDELVRMADGVFDAALNRTNWRDVDTTGDPNTGKGRKTVTQPTPELSALRGKQGRGFQVSNLTPSEYTRIPKSIRDRLVKGATDESA